MKTNDKHLPSETYSIAQRLHEGLAADRVYLFGSHARGEGSGDSDLDFLVVVPESTQSRYDRAVEAHRLLRGMHSPADIMVLTRAEWDREIKAPCSLPSTVLREGIVLGNGPGIS